MCTLSNINQALCLNEHSLLTSHLNLKKKYPPNIVIKLISDRDRNVIPSKGFAAMTSITSNTSVQFLVVYCF